MNKFACFIMATILVSGCASRSGGEFREGGKEIGQGFKKMGTETGEVVKKTGKAIGEGFKKAGQETGKAMKEMGQEIGDGFKE